MRIPKFGKTLIAAGLAVAFGLIITGAASADNKQQPFRAVGVSGAVFSLPAGLDNGNVANAGASGRWIVKDRTFSGVLIDGPLAGNAFSFVFGTNVPIATQSGQVHGKVDFSGPSGTRQANIRASSQGGICNLPLLNGYPALLIEGTYTFTSGSQGNGDVKACVIPAVNPVTGHIDSLIAAVVILDGKWTP